MRRCENRAVRRGPGTWSTPLASGDALGSIATALRGGYGRIAMRGWRSSRQPLMNLLDFKTL